MFIRKPEGYYVLGIDLGVASVGLALIETRFGEICHSSVRIFSEGMTGSEKDWENGKEVSNATVRREARGQRRQTERRKRRIKKVFHLLRSYDWLPDVSGPNIQDALNALDLELANRYGQHHNLPYFLRARGLDEKLSLTELGRAIYHLAQRRGFLSNRKLAPKKDDDMGKVYAGIDSLREEVSSSGKRTLGEYFASLDPEEQKIRGRYTYRDMYVQEFQHLWAAQQNHHPEELTAVRQATLFRALFFQRPLKDQSHLIGHCDLEEKEQRAPMYLLSVQRYRFLTALNNLRLAGPGAVSREISADERQAIIEKLGQCAKLSFTEIRKMLGVPKTFKFSIEEGGETKIPGNLTASLIYGVCPALWTGLDQASRDRLVDVLKRLESVESLDDRALALRNHWDVSDDEIDKLLSLKLPSEYASISLRAINRLLPLLEEGLTFAAAKHQLYPETDNCQVESFLPQVKDVFREIRNPAVLRSLSEMRKCVNAYIRHFGKPDEIHIELARDLRRSKGDRAAMTKEIRQNELARKKAYAALIENGIPNPSRWEVEKFLLWEECRRECPYSGKAISFHSLFVEQQFEVEHIIPYSRCLDDSRANRTLAHVEYNRIKGNRTPVEAFCGREDWPEMKGRFARFARTAKLRRFLMTETDAAELLKDFTERQLNDTKYASKLAAKYLARLYGGKSDETGMRVLSCAGKVTSALRRVWDMNRVLNVVPEKSRDDHRHHAVDAVAIALCSSKWIKALSDASAKTLHRRPLRSALLADPWPGFRDDLNQKIHEQTPVSHRPKRKLSAALHGDTIYSRPQIHNGKAVFHLRKPVFNLESEADIGKIVDPVIRECVREKFLEVGRDAKRLEHDVPRMRSGVPIRTVRVRQTSVSAVALGTGAAKRYVNLGGNHHMEMIAILDDDCKETGYEASVVSYLEANQRKRRAEPIVKRDHGLNRRFLFSLSAGDIVQYGRNGQTLGFWLVRGVTTDQKGRLDLCRLTDARIKSEQERERPTAAAFLKAKGRKVNIAPIGTWTYAND